jgi:hypothetical protein
MADGEADEEDARVYLPIVQRERLFQGEILSNVVERRAIRQADGSTFDLSEILHPFALIISQDCDLQQDAHVRGGSVDATKRENAALEHVLLVVASEYDKARDRFAGSDVRKRARMNKDERFHFLCRARREDDALAQGTPALVLDFKRIFSYPTTELLGSISSGETKRRSRLAPTYLEHLSSRTGYFIQRVALPADHHDLDPAAPVLALPAG